MPHICLRNKMGKRGIVDLAGFLHKAAVALVSATGHFACIVRGVSKSPRGALLLDSIIAIFIFTIVGTAVVAGLGTTHRSGFQTERQSVAENIARNQMESVFSQPYQPPPFTCTPITVPAGYTVTCRAETYVIGDTNIEKIVVTVLFNNTVVLTLQALRSNI
jgi:type II secretory pathway pseudopilin PulG